MQTTWPDGRRPQNPKGGRTTSSLAIAPSLLALVLCIRSAADIYATHLPVNPHHRLRDGMVGIIGEEVAYDFPRNVFPWVSYEVR